MLLVWRFWIGHVRTTPLRDRLLHEPNNSTQNRAGREPPSAMSQVPFSGACCGLMGNMVEEQVTWHMLSQMGVRGGGVERERICSLKHELLVLSLFLSQVFFLIAGKDHKNSIFMSKFYNLCVKKCIKRSSRKKILFHGIHGYYFKTHSEFSSWQSWNSVRVVKNHQDNLCILSIDSQSVNLI